MKQKLCLLIAFVFAASAAMAQFTVGVKAGANITKIDGRSFEEEFNYGYHAGGFALIGLGQKFGLQPEVLYNQLQTKTSNNFTDIYENAFDDARNREIKLNYLSIPILLNYKAIGNFLSIQAGPQFGILLDNNKNLLENGKAAFDRGDFSMLGGAQIKVSKLVVTGRYVVGLNNINDIDDQDKWKNQGFQLSLGLSL